MGFWKRQPVESCKQNKIAFCTFLASLLLCFPSFVASSFLLICFLSSLLHFLVSSFLLFFICSFLLFFCSSFLRYLTSLFLGCAEGLPLLPCFLGFCLRFCSKRLILLFDPVYVFCHAVNSLFLILLPHYFSNSHPGLSPFGLSAVGIACTYKNTVWRSIQYSLENTNVFPAGHPMLLMCDNIHEVRQIIHAGQPNIMLSLCHYAFLSIGGNDGKTWTNTKPKLSKHLCSK